MFPKKKRKKEKKNKTIIFEISIDTNVRKSNEMFFKPGNRCTNECRAAQATRNTVIKLNDSCPARLRSINRKEDYNIQYRKRSCDTLREGHRLNVKPTFFSRKSIKENIGT